MKDALRSMYSSFCMVGLVSGVLFGILTRSFLAAVLVVWLFTWLGAKFWSMMDQDMQNFDKDMAERSQQVVKKAVKGHYDTNTLRDMTNAVLNVVGLELRKW